MLIKSDNGKILYNIDSSDVEKIYMMALADGFSINVHRWSDDNDVDIMLGRYRSEEVARKNFEGLIKFFQTMLGSTYAKQSEIFYMTPND